MRRKLVIWVLTLGSSLYVLPFATCATSAISGSIKAFKPCDVFNCNDPNYFDPCVILNCSEAVRAPTYGSSD